MNCSHCDHWNPEDEERCRLCGRKLRPGGKDSSGEWALHVVSGSLAAAPERAPSRQEQIMAAAGAPQRMLFPERPAGSFPFEVLPGGARPARAGSKPPAPRRPQAGAQTELDFLPPAPITPRKLPTRVESSIYCDAPVATLTHRAFAGAVDFSLILIAYAICMSSYYFMGGAWPASRTGYLMFGTALVLLAMFYGLVWALGNTETPGMRWARLKLTNFDGFPPEPRQRLWRYFSTSLGFATFGFGILWALVDEESLAWQDHISKTFPTFDRNETNFCKGR